MTAQIIDGKNIAKQLRAELRETVNAKVNQGVRRPGFRGFRGFRAFPPSAQPQMGGGLE